MFFLDASPLNSKNSEEVSSAFENIYGRKFDYPKTLIVHPGTEFFGKLTKLMEKHNVKIQGGEKNLHRAQAFVERANRTLGEKIFSHQYPEEMVMKKGERSPKWVKRLPEIIKTLNNTTTKLIGESAIKAYKEKIVDEKIKQIG